MLTQLLQEIVVALYNRNPDAYLMHADLYLEETKHDPQNSVLYVRGTFSVSVTPVIKVELHIDTTFDKTDNNKGWTRSLGLFTVKHTETNMSVEMANYKGKATIWCDAKRGEAFKTMIGNSPPVPQ